MQRTILVGVAALVASCLSTAFAQDFSRFNFNIGGGPSAPINPTARYVGLSGNFNIGAGYNINKKNSITGEFLWVGLPSNLDFHPIDAPSIDMNLYSLAVNYRYHADSIRGSHFGLYALGGGGWYYRHASLDRNIIVPPSTVCTPIYFWWGYGCDPGGYVISEQIASRGNSAGGVNAGVGFTVRLTDSGLKFYVESRYHYAWTSRVPTTFAPVTFGFRFN